LIKTTDGFAPLAEDVELPVGEAVDERRHLSGGGPPDRGKACQSLEHPTYGRRHGGLMPWVRDRLVGLCQWLAPSARRHRVDPQRASPDQQHPVPPAGLFDPQRRDTHPRGFANAQAPFDPGLAWIGVDDFGSAPCAGVTVGFEDTARLALLPLRKRLLVRPGVGLAWPRARLQRRVRCRAALAGLALVVAQAVGSDLVRGPAPGHRCERFVGHLRGRATLGLPVQEVWCDGGLFALPRVGDGGFGALRGRL
jgi:hypothetical protein